MADQRIRGQVDFHEILPLRNLGKILHQMPQIVKEDEKAFDTFVSRCCEGGAGKPDF